MINTVEERNIERDKGGKTDWKEIKTKEYIVNDVEERNMLINKELNKKKRMKKEKYDGYCRRKKYYKK